MSDVRLEERTLAKATWPAHALAMLLSMSYAWGISKTAYVQTSLQFISPLLIIALVHLLWLLATRGRQPGYARTVVDRALVSSLFLALLVPAIISVAPMPSTASSGDGAINQFLIVIFCLAILAIVLAAAIFILYLFFGLLGLAARAIGKLLGNGTRLNDVSILATLFVVVTLASLEGIAGFYRFTGSGQATASVTVDAQPVRVWAAMQTATAAEFPLPDILEPFPRPVAVRVDEGTELGAKRVVVFAGREGRGELHLEVVEREGLRSVFKTVSDTTPMAQWIAIDSIAYEVVPQNQGSLLRVTLNYERLLAPSLIFSPMMAFAGELAMEVLAEDTKVRAESGR